MPPTISAARAAALSSPYRLMIVRSVSRIRPGAPELDRGVEQPNTLNYPPEIVRPPNSRTVSLSVNTALAAAAGAIVTPAGFPLQLAKSEVGVIDQIDLLLNGIVLGSTVTWMLLVNGAPPPGFGAMTILGRDGAASVSKTYGPQLRITVPAGGVISVVITNGDGAAGYTAGVGVLGWAWPRATVSLPRVA